MKSLLLLFLSLSTFAYSQTAITGFIIDKDTQQAIPYATVYISGTSNGTTTTPEGYFKLDNIIFPCQLIISHVSYQTCAININTREDNVLRILMHAKTVKLTTVEIEDQNKRQYNINRFTSEFVGHDYWGKKAKLENSNTLVFQKKMAAKQIQRSKMAIAADKGKVKLIDSLHSATIKREVEFRVSSDIPLIVDIPELGYRAQIDLVDFVIKEFKDQQLSSSLAYYYYQPYAVTKKRQQRKYDKNRKLAYYNSAQHFLHSLYDKTLKENGYIVYETIDNDSTNTTHLKEINLYKYISYDNEQSMTINHLKDKNLSIVYFFSRDASPLDLTLKKTKKRYHNSAMYLLEDKCAINKHGIMPNTSILFNGSIASKKAGASLPADYKITLSE